MKKLTIALGVITSAIASPLYAADECVDFSGTYAGNCVNFPSEYSQVRSIIDQDGCGNVQVILDIILTELNEEKHLGVPVGGTLVLRALDLHPGDILGVNTETFVRNEVGNDDEIIITTNSRSSAWNNEGTDLNVDEDTVVTVNGFLAVDTTLVGTFSRDTNDNTMNLNITEGEDDPYSSGDCKLFKLP